MNSGTRVLAAMTALPYTAVPVVIDRAGRWQVADEAAATRIDVLGALQRRGVDAAFIALHGPFGEDGRMQGLLDMVGIPGWQVGYCGMAFLTWRASSVRTVSASQM